MPENDYEKHSHQTPLLEETLLGRADDYTYLNPGSYEISGEASMLGPDDFFEIGQSSLDIAEQHEIGVYSKSFDARPPRLTGKLSYAVKHGVLNTSAQVYLPAADSSMLISVKTPIAPILALLQKAGKQGASLPQLASMLGLEEEDVHEIGWSPFSYAKKKARKLRKMAKKAAKAAAKKALKHTVKSKRFKRLVKKASAVAKTVAKKAKVVAKNPYVQKFATGAAVAVSMYFGVPPTVTMAATGLLFNAMNGDGVSVDKVKEIALLAAEGYAPARKMKAVLTTLYKGGMKDMKPHLEKAQAVAQASFQSKSLAIAKAALPSDFKLSESAPKSMFPFNLPGYDLGPPISGWIYNIPYRSNVQAKSLDVFGKGRSPLHLLRGAYSKGMA